MFIVFSAGAVCLFIAPLVGQNPVLFVIFPG